MGRKFAHGSDTPRSEAVRRCEGVYVTYSLESAWSPTSVLGHVVILGWLAAGVHLWRRRRSALVLASALWFVVPLLPVAHVLFPLQNWIADRYLWLSVAAVSLSRRWVAGPEDRIDMLM
jgi:hypothetical protein